MKKLVFTILLTAAITHCSAILCKENEFECIDGERCIKKGFVCDDFPNCLDHSDEEAELCETWDYDYEYTDEEDTGGGWFGLWGAKEGEGEGESEPPDEAEEDTFVESKEKPPEDEIESKPEAPPETCSLNRCIPSGPLSYFAGKSYNYAYEVHSTTQARSPDSSQTSTVVISSDVTINVINACEMDIKLQNVESRYSTMETLGKPAETVNNDSFLQALEKEALRFSMIGGVVDFLCPALNEDPRVLNFKRGILSMLQNTMPKLHLSHSQVERDVIGECETNYKFKPENQPNTVIIKTRNIPSCKKRSHIFSMAHSVPYDFPQASPDIPIVDTESACEQQIKYGIIMSTKCIENHKVIPLTSEKGEILTTINQTLTFVRDGFSISSLGPVYRRTGIEFDHHDHVSTNKSIINDHLTDDSKVMDTANQILDLVSSSKMNATPANIFSYLVAALRHLTFDQLKKLNKERKWLQDERKYFQDAMPMVGTAASLRFMTQEMTEDIAVWISSLSYIQKPDLDVIEAASGILDLQQKPDKVYMFVGSLLNNYCIHNPSCSYDGGIRSILDKFGTVISSSCSPQNRQKKLQVLYTLRGLGNAGMALNDNILESLNSCLLEEGADMEIRVTAVEAFRRVPCNVSRASFQRILADMNEDSEIRISSYLGLMRCPNYEVIQYVEKILEAEEVNQVGSFIWTHLKNIQETGSPSKTEVQSLLSNRNFQEKFKSDFRTYSRNIEWSGFYDELNVGGFLDSNIVFSQKSFVPRSASLNLTADLFGRSFNFLELQTRVEGLEKHIANYFGEVLQNNEDKSKEKSIKNPKIREVIRKSDRAREYLDQEAEVSFSMKTFGNDVLYQHLTGTTDIISFFKDLDPWAFLASLQEGREFQFEKSWLPLDTSYQLATSAGLPLNINLEGSISVDTSARLEISSPTLVESQKHLSGYLKPTISIDLTASMILDCHAAQTGVEMATSFYSSTVIDGSIGFNGLKTLSIDFNMPRDTMEIVKVSSKLSLLHGPAHSSQMNKLQESVYKEIVKNLSVPPQVSQECTRNEQLFGSKLCWSKEYPNVNDGPLNQKFLLNGPVTYNMILDKTDPSLNSFKFRYHWNMEPEGFMGVLLFDTPGSTIPREHVVNCTINFIKNDVSLVMKNPTRSIKARGRYTWTQEEKRIDVSVEMNEKEVSSFSVGFKIYDRSGQRVVIPTFSVNWRNKPLIKISGNMEQREKTTDKDTVHYSVNLSFDFYMSDTGNPGSGTIGGYINHQNEEWDASLDILYKFETSEQQHERIRLEYNRIMKIGGYPFKVERSWRISFSQFPYLNCKGKWSRKSYSGSLENGIKISLGTDFDNPLHEVTLYHNIIAYVGSEQTSFNTTVAVKYPKNKLDVVIGLDFYQDIRDINSGFIFQYATGQAVTSRFHVIQSFSGPRSVEANWYFYFPESLNLSAKGTLTGSNSQDYEFDLQFSWTPSRRIEFTGHYMDLSTRLKSLHELEMKIKLPSREVVYTYSTFLLDETQIIVGCQVKTESGAKYKVRLAYISQLDDLLAHRRRIEIDVNLPTRTYYWHSEITFGEFVTLSSDIHVDRSRDLNLWLQIHRADGGSKKIMFKLLWDANRDPQKKAELEIFLGEGLFNMKSSITFLGNEYKATWESFRQYTPADSAGKLHWTHKHGGEISWKDNDRKTHKMTTGASFTLNRNVGADFVANIYLTTPFDHWSNNSAQVIYTRDSDKILATLKARWHLNEYLNMTYGLTKDIKDSEFHGQTSLEILSFMNENLVSLSAGAALKKIPGTLDGNVFMKWDNDRIELIIEGKDLSGANDVTISLSAKVYTTLQGYTHLSTFFDLYAVKGSVRLHSSAVWEDLVYELQCSGDLHSAQDYLKGEVRITTPSGGHDAATAHIRVYHDPVNHDENLKIFGRWLNKQLNLEGRVAAYPQDFKAELNLDTPFEKLSQASIVIGHSIKEHYQTLALVKWNRTRTLGFDIESRMNSLTDFRMSLTLMTPFSKFKEVRAEVKNSFSLSPDVRVNARIFGQIDEKKYGLGARYQQGIEPRLLVGLELYTPIEDLQEVSVDISDASAFPKMKYSVDVKYGSVRAISVATEYEQREKSLNVAVRSKINLSSLLGVELDEVKLEGEVKLEWMDANDFSIRMGAVTKTDNYKIYTTGMIGHDGMGKIEANLALPISMLRDLEFKFDYRRATHWQNGYLKTHVISGHETLLYVYIFGTLREATITFTSMIENFSKGSLIYKLIPLDVIRSKLEATASLEDKEIRVDGLVYLNNENFITKMEVTLTAPHHDFNQTRLLVEGREDGNGFKNSWKLVNKDVTYEGHILWSIMESNFWKVDGTVSKKTDEGLTEYNSIIIYENIISRPFRASIKVKGPDSYVIFCDLKIQKDYWPYTVELDWETPSTSVGNSKVTINSFQNERISLTVTSSLAYPAGTPAQGYQLIIDLKNRSTKEIVDLEIHVQFESDNEAWDHMLLEGNLRQVTMDENGILKVHLEWPKMEPVTFSAEASYFNDPHFDLRTSVQLDLPKASYGFLGHVMRPGGSINLSGGIWWKREVDAERKKILLTIDLTFLRNGLDGKGVLKLPMVPGFEINTADMSLRRVKDFNDISLIVKAGHTDNSLKAIYRLSELPATEGNITISSSLFWQGNPIFLRFSQSLMDTGYNGNYYLEWPLWDMKTETYVREPVTAKLEHYSLTDGHQGVFQIESRLTKGKPVKLSYTFQFPSRPYVLVKLGIGYENLKLELKGEYRETRTQNQHLKKTAIELDNLIWPFGVAYIDETLIISSEEKEINDRLEIYDLDNESSRSSVSIVRKKNEDGGRFAIQGHFIERELEVSSGYKTLSGNFGADVLISWAADQKLEAVFDWKDNSKPPYKHNHIVTARISHPLRTVTLEAILTQIGRKSFAELTLHSDFGVSEKIPLKITLIAENPEESRSDRHYKGNLRVSHPSLPTAVTIEGELKRDYQYPLLFKLLLKYSEMQSRDLSVEAQIRRDVENRQFDNTFEAVHQSSNLHAKATGVLTYGYDTYAFFEDLLYTDINGTELKARVDGGLDIVERSLHAVVESAERVIDLKMRIEEKEQGVWEVLTTSETHKNIPFRTSLQLHPSQPIFILTIQSLKGENGSTEYETIENPDYPLYAAEQVIVNGGYEDRRNIYLSVKHMEPLSLRRDNSSWIQDADFSFRLNHSRLLSSHLGWRKRIEEELRNEIKEFIGLSQEIQDSTKAWIKETVKLVGKEVLNRSKPVIVDVIQATSPLIAHLKNESVGFREDLLTLFRSINLTKKESNLKSSIEYTLANLGKSLEKISLVEKIKKILAKGTLRLYISNFLTKIKNFYHHLFSKDPSTGGIAQRLRDLLSSFASAYDQAVKQWYLSFRNALSDFNMRLRDWLRRKWHSVYENYKPHILKTLHILESASYNILSKLWNYMNQLGADLKSMSYVQTIQQIYSKIKAVYIEMSNRTLKQNLEMLNAYVELIIEKGLNLVIAKILPFMEDWLGEVDKAWRKLHSFENAREVIYLGRRLIIDIQWLLNRISLINTIAFSVEHGYTIITQKATETQLRHIKAKTDMNWNPHKGEIQLLQKLPFDWISFNQTPEWQELMEIPVITPLRNFFFPSTKFSVLDTWYKYFNLNFYPSTWIPPFPAVGYIVGENHILTFDGKLVTYRGVCEHLLAADLIHGQWAVTIKYNKHTPKIINIYVDHKVIEFSKQFKVKIDGRLTVLPYAVSSSVAIWRTAGTLNLELESGLKVSWNLEHDVVSISVPSTAFLNTAGLLGTNNNEPIDDMISPDGKTHFGPDNLRAFLDSWKVSQTSCETEPWEPHPETSSDILTICDNLFASRSSPFKYCFYQVDPLPYYKMCKSDFEGQDEDSSAAALAYRERCSEQSVPVKLPVNYLQCEYTNGTSKKIKRVQEGQTVTLRKEDIENAVDVVLLVEMSPCNKQRLQTKQFERFMVRFNDGLVEEGVAATRYAVVAYGTDKPYSSPTLVSSDIEYFTSAKKIGDLMKDFNFPSNQEGRSNFSSSQTFKAITYASNLAFRSPSTVVFLLFPCSPCQESVELDYSTMYHILLNNAATLHIFKESYFDIDKATQQSKVIGYDQNTAYLIRHYNKGKMGDSSLKKQIRPPKEELNLCLPLAIETEGAVFTTQPLSEPRKKVAERYGIVVGRRAAQNAKQDYDQKCLCLSTQEVTPIMRCDKWEHGDFSVLQRYGLEVNEKSTFFEDRNEENPLDESS